MLCSVADSLLGTWFAMTAVGLVAVLTLSGVFFRHYYLSPTFEQWVNKTNPAFPPAESVRAEVLKTCKGILVATLCPAVSLALARRGLSQAYCGVGEHGWGYLIGTFAVVWVVADFYEFFYHRMGHTIAFWWGLHRSHHRFHNPTPFAVIADDVVDQFMRSLPLLVFPLIAPVNLDLIFAEFAVFFYLWGTCLHLGYEPPAIDFAHSGFVNAGYHHYLHHAKSVAGKPYYTGFFFRAWDRMFGSEYPGKCLCARCCAGRGERSREAFDKLEKPNYMAHFARPSFWISGK
jgi:lathosterol oxidase